ncbi:reverse transcriptase domain-containing protein [Tanacetum coccineum]
MGGRRKCFVTALQRYSDSFSDSFGTEKVLLFGLNVNSASVTQLSLLGLWLILLALSDMGQHGRIWITNNDEIMSVFCNVLWMICGIPIFLNKWSPSMSLLKEELTRVPVWVKFHDVTLVAYTSDSLSLMATKIGTPIMLDSYKNFIGSVYMKETIHIEYEWKPPRCSTCWIFGHSLVDCPKVVPKRVVNHKDKGMSLPKATPFVGTSKASTSGYNKESPSNKGDTFSLSNSFKALNDENIIIKEVASGSMASTSGTPEEGQSSTPIVDKIKFLEKQILEGKLVLVDDDGKLLEKGSSNSDTDKIMARIDAMTMKMDAQYKELQSHAKQPTPDLNEDDIPMSYDEEAKFMQTFPVRINVPLVDVLAEMPNYEKFLKELISNKHKIEQISAAFLSDESSAMIQNKVPPKHGDPESFLIPCNFNKTFSCNALADLGASIYLMPYSLYAKLCLKTLKPTKMSVRLADRSFQYPVGIVENMLIEVGKFTFPANFVILEMEEDNKVPLILGRPFLHTADAVIPVKQKQLNLGVGTERMIFNIDSTMKHSYSNDDTCFRLIIDDILEE